MIVEAGVDSELFLELDDEGNAQLPGGVQTRGCHLGKFVPLNIRNPQPGKFYYWELKNEANLLSAHTWGWEPIRLGDPEFPEDDIFPHQGADTTLTFGELIALRIDETDYRRWQEEQDQAARDQLEGAGQAFLNIPEEEAKAGHGRPTRWVADEKFYGTQPGRRIGAGIWNEEV